LLALPSIVVFAEIVALLVSTGKFVPLSGPPTAIAALIFPDEPTSAVEYPVALTLTPSIVNVSPAVQSAVATLTVSVVARGVTGLVTVEPAEVVETTTDCVVSKFKVESPGEIRVRTISPAIVMSAFSPHVITKLLIVTNEVVPLTVVALVPPVIPGATAKTEADIARNKPVEIAAIMTIPDSLFNKTFFIGRKVIYYLIYIKF
jgi:hypothetical protein